MNTLIGSLLIAMASWTAAPSTAVRAVTIEGETIVGQWVGIAQDGAIQIKLEDESKSLAVDELMSIHWPEPKSRPRKAPALEVHMVNGCQLRGVIVDEPDGAPALKTELAARWPLKLSNLVAIRNTRLNTAPIAQAFDKAMADRHASEDTMIIVRDDKIRTVRGITESLGTNGTFKWRQRDVPIDWTTVAGIVFAKGVQSPSKPGCLCELHDGSIWAGSIVSSNDRTITMQMTDGPKINDAKIGIPVADIAKIEFRSDRMTFVDTLNPRTYRFEPFDATQWPYRLNRSVANRPLRIGQRTFDRGIGVHSQSTLEYELTEPYKQFAAVIGIDEGVGDLGNVEFHVVADGKEVYNSGPVTGNDEPRDILVAIDNVKSLQLIVTFGEDLDIGDQANWANARLIK